MIWASSRLLPNQDSPARHTLRVPAPAKDSHSPHGDNADTSLVNEDAVHSSPSGDQGL